MGEKPIKSKFLRISCPRCQCQQIVFGKSATTIKCKKCNYMLLKTTGGKARMRAQVKQIIWN